MNNETRIQEIKKELASVPTLPGVYLWKDKDGQVIYVGKAKQLRARMKQYVMGQDERAKFRSCSSSNRFVRSTSWSKTSKNRLCSRRT